MSEPILHVGHDIRSAGQRGNEQVPRRVFDLAEIHAHPCPNLLYDLLAAGRLNDQGRLEVPAAAAEAILAACPDPGLRGLGDVVAVLAQPIARTIDHMAGTKIKDCGGCAKRRAILNAVWPFKAS